MSKIAAACCHPLWLPGLWLKTVAVHVAVVRTSINVGEDPGGGGGGGGGTCRAASWSGT